MKVKVKSKEELLKIFKKEGYIKQHSEYFSKADRLFFECEKFRFCDKILDVEFDDKYGHLYSTGDGGWYTWKKEWIEFLDEGEERFFWDLLINWNHLGIVNNLYSKVASENRTFMRKFADKCGGDEEFVSNIGKYMIIMEKNPEYQRLYNDYVCIGLQDNLYIEAYENLQKGVYMKDFIRREELDKELKEITEMSKEEVLELIKTCEGVEVYWKTYYKQEIRFYDTKLPSCDKDYVYTKRNSDKNWTKTLIVMQNNIMNINSEISFYNNVITVSREKELN